jgi:hypothetical protein
MALVSAELRIRVRLPIGARECDCRETGSNAVQTDTFRGNHVAMTSDLSLSGRRIVISGAGRGLGRALAITAADHGADLVLLGRNVVAL